jgi:hypothetical protein
VLIRTGSGGGTHEFLTWLASLGRRLHYSIGMTITDDMQDAILALPDRIWEPAYDAGAAPFPLRVGDLRWTRGGPLMNLAGLPVLTTARRRRGAH